MRIIWNHLDLDHWSISNYDLIFDWFLIIWISCFFAISEVDHSFILIGNHFKYVLAGTRKRATAQQKSGSMFF